MTRPRIRGALSPYNHPMPPRKRLPAEPFQVQIERQLDNGRGLAAHEERRLEVHDALGGEVVLARYLFGRRFRGQATTLEVLHASPHRAQPACPHFGTCSACVLQHMDAPAQLEFKQARLLRILAEAGASPEAVLPPLAAEPWHYRRKARLSVRYVEAKGRVLLGFRERDGRFVTDMRECHTLAPQVGRHLPALRALLGVLQGARSIPQIEVSCGDDSAALIFRHLEPLSGADLEGLRDFARNTGLAVLLQPGGPDTVSALEPAAPELSYALPGFGLAFHFQPLDFIQVNGALNRLMVSQALELLQPGGDEAVLDLFCGLGNFSLPLAQRAGRVTGVEGDAGLVRRALANTSRNAVGNADFRCADLYAEDADLSWTRGAFDKVLLDPPRSGAAPLLRAVADTGASRLVYVSCNPETLAEDAGKLLREHGFRLAAAGLMDMFPQTTHIEAMALFERDGGGRG